MLESSQNLIRYYQHQRLDLKASTLQYFNTSILGHENGPISFIIEPIALITE